MKQSASSGEVVVVDCRYMVSICCLRYCALPLGDEEQVQSQTLQFVSAASNPFRGAGYSGKTPVQTDTSLAQWRNRRVGKQSSVDLTKETVVCVGRGGGGIHHKSKVTKE